MILLFLETGELFTWGSGEDGQLGLGNILSQYTPQLVTFTSNDFYGKGEMIYISEVSCGDRHTSVITSTN